MGLSTRTLFVGNLPGYIRQREVEDLFCKFGPIVELDLKIPPRPPAFAFVEFEDARDAQDAIRERDGYKFNGRHIRVKLAHGGRVSSSVDRYSSGGSRAGITRRTDFRVHVTGLPPSASWQDLKDHMRQGGDVCYSQVFRDRAGVRGVVDYTNYDDMKHAIRKLDDSLFFNMFAKAYIRVCLEKSSEASESCNKAGIEYNVEEYEQRHRFSRNRTRSPTQSHSYDSRSYSPRKRYSSSSRSRSISSPAHSESTLTPASRCGAGA